METEEEEAYLKQLWKLGVCRFDLFGVSRSWEAGPPLGRRPECVQPPATPFFRWESVSCTSRALLHSPRGAQQGTLSRVWAALGDRGRAFTTEARSDPRCPLAFPLALWL